MNFFPADHRPGSQPSKLHVARATALHCFQFANSTPAFHTATIRQDRQGFVVFFVFLRMTETHLICISFKNVRGVQRKRKNRKIFL